MDILEEHIGYLSRPGRMALFERALAKVVNPGDVVADLGCGVGVLGMAALKAGAARVYGIERGDAVELARESVHRAGLSDRYTCIKGSTYQVALPEPADVLICDHVGHFGFDYGIAPMLADARRRMLRPGGQIMPRRLRLVMAGAQSQAARKPIDAWNEDLVPQDLRWLREQAVNTKQAYKFTQQEIRTAPGVLGEIDLTIDPPASWAFETQLVAAEDCRIDGLACWFECELAEGVWMTNSPLDPESIRRTNTFLAAQEPFAVSAGETIKVSLRIRPEDFLIAWTIGPPGGARRQKLSTWNSRFFDPADLASAKTGPVALNPAGKARKFVLGLADGTRSRAEIEQVAIDHTPPLFPTAEEIRRFVRNQLDRDTAE